MKKIAVILFLFSALFAHADMYEKFKNPEKEFGAYAFWWWTWDTSDKWSKEGITKSLEEMSQKGMGGVMLFTIGGADNPGGIKYMGDDFVGLFKHAAEECARLGMKLAFQICDGWATAGGEWITPELSMKKLVQEGFVILGGTDFSEKIKRPETVGGYYKDISVLAFPHGKEILTDGDVLDLSGNLKADGTFSWNAPAENNWTVIRYGYTLTGAKNGPANASGYECDKLDSKGVEAQFENQVKVLLDACAHLPLEKRPIPWQDSYEAGMQNWTEQFPAFFKERNGYEIGKFLLSFSTDTPFVSAEATQKFKDDFWGTVWDCMRENYILKLKEAVNGQGRPFISETYPEEADIPVGEFWLVSRNDVEHTPDGQIHCGNIGDFNSAIWTPNTFEIAKRAQFRGQNVIGAEAWTTRSPCFERTFSDLKAGANYVFAQGVNMLIHHNFVNQWDDKKPGRFNHGVAINQNQTWWDDIAEAWFAYIARSQYLLRLGRPSSDVLVLDSSDGARKAENIMPSNVSFAVCKADEFLKFARSENGKTVNPCGDEFQAIFVADDYVGVDVVSKLNGFANVFYYKDGELEKMLRTIKPEISELPDGLHFIHRKYGGADIYFIANSSKGKIGFNCNFRDLKENAQVWNPENGGRQNLSDILYLDGGGSVFVLSGDGINKLKEKNYETYAVEDLSGNWIVGFDEKYGAPSEVEFAELSDWTSLSDESLKYYSSTAVYKKSFKLAEMPKPKKVILDLGKVGEYAKVFVNGKCAATLWTPPFECDITKFIKMGENRLEIKVVNTWTNRLIGDAATGKKYLDVFPPVHETEPFTKDSPLRPSGLIGPVKIILQK